MKTWGFVVLLGCAWNLHADEAGQSEKPKEEKVTQDPRLVRALAGLEKRMGIEFKIPFPANFDVDAYMKRPLAMIEVDGRKVSATRPIVNPYDEPRTVEWMLGPADLAKLGSEEIDCKVDFDEKGELVRLNLLADWAANETGDHQIGRGESESEADFFLRARFIYQNRAGKAQDPAFARLVAVAFEKITTAIQSLREEQH